MKMRKGNFPVKEKGQKIFCPGCGFELEEGWNCTFSGAKLGICPGCFHILRWKDSSVDLYAYPVRTPPDLVDPLMSRMAPSFLLENIKKRGFALPFCIDDYEIMQQKEIEKDG